MREKKYNQIDNITTGRNIFTLRHSLDREITEFTILSQSPDDPDPGLYIPSSTTRLLNLANLWVRLSMYLMASRMMSSCVTFSLIQRLGSSCWSLECWQQWRSWPSDFLCLGNVHNLPAKLWLLCLNLLFSETVNDRGLGLPLVLLIVCLAQHHHDVLTVGWSGLDWRESCGAAYLYCWTATWLTPLPHIETCSGQSMSWHKADIPNTGHE